MRKKYSQQKYKEEQAANVKLSDSLSQVNTEIESLRSNLKSLKAEEVQKSKELSELQSCLESTKLEFANKQTIMEQQIGALRFQLSSHQMEADLAMDGYRQQQEDLQKMSQTISSQEKTVATIEMQLDTLQTEKSLDTDRHQQQVEELISLLDDKELDLVSLCEEIEAYKKRCSELTESHETLNQKMIELKLGKGERLAEAENELHQLRDENVILKKRLIKLIKDKDSLWQATDALIFRQKKLSEVKWLDSSKIDNCMGCRAAFSLLLRKHHCRLCGQVYCYQCSDNWVNTAASGKKSRVCNLCYIEHTNSDLPAALNSSNITDTNSGLHYSPVTLHDTSWSRDSGGKYSPPSGANRSTVSSTAAGDTSQSTDSLTLDVSSTGDTTSDNTDTGLQAPVSDDVTEGVEAECTQVTSDPGGVVSQATGRASDPGGVVSQATGRASDPGGVVSQATGIASEPDSVNNQPADNIVSNGFNDFGVEGEVTDAVSTVSVPSATRLLKQLKVEYDSVISAESIQSDELIEISINKMSVYTVCVVVDKEETTLGWKFSSQPKAAYFQLTHKPYETSFSDASEHLIPECKCRSHRQEVQGEMISHNSGLYIFSFINKLDRKLEVQYNIRVSVN
ncbi:FYCO1 [Bugula neritina]|uniref:FYCO1 n=1 Tax=Bugula neritina TaxID=10212 RepID=A0A7J7K9G4_BUGNE|nr:FYCO1 [Bugula neritina]